MAIGSGKVVQGCFATGNPRFVSPPPPVVQARRSPASPSLPSTGASAIALSPHLANFGPAMGRRLPETVQRKMESLFGASFTDVRVHVGPQAASIGALAFTQGSDLYSATGQYNPETARGQQLIAHELTHVVQQRAGRVRNPLGSGVAIVQDRALEAEAERMALRATAPAAVQAKPSGGPVSAAPHASIQRSGPVSVSGMIPVGGGSYRIQAGVGGHQVGSVMVHSRDRSSIEVSHLGVSPSTASTAWAASSWHRPCAPVGNWVGPR